MNVALMWNTGEVQPGRINVVLTAPGLGLLVTGTLVNCGYCGHSMAWSHWVPNRCLRGVYAAIFDNSRRLP